MAHKKKVLVVDDDKFFRDILKKEFTDAGFQVFVARDGQEGLEMFKEMKPDVVIADKVMPKMGGTRFLSKARELEFSKNVIFVTLSALIKDPPHEHDKEVLGSRVHIPKSSRPVDIVILVEQLLSREQ
jgi:CheY-like chemotaxis protein